VRNPGNFPDTATRVEQNTAADVNQRIRERTEAALQSLEEADIDELTDRLRALDSEWDVERTLQLNASVLAGLGVALGARVDRRFLLLPLAVFAFLETHALQGWCPPLPVLRRLGVRTRKEIERERMALKMLRGDFRRMPGTAAQPSERVRAALECVDR
jgi:hypothetical protein